ncbi:hypothetical protein ACFZDJ_47810 [Streptomyces sp. NPDC007896]|uniref:hypothetical protein n=1 Tax=Streptomyces sp. NPDC007896 TaxID=3364784 RepID=UPI0036E5ED11
MPTPDIPRQDLPPAVREAAVRATAPSIRVAQQTIARLQRDWARCARVVLAPMQETQQAAVQQAVERWGHGFRVAYATAVQQQAGIADTIARASLSLDTTGLDRVLRCVQAWQALTEQQRAAAVSAVQDAYATTLDADVPGDLVDGLDETVREFAASEADFLPTEVQRRVFVLFVGTAVLLLLIQLSFTDDTAGEVMAQALEVAPLAAVAMAAAARPSPTSYPRTPPVSGTPRPRNCQSPSAFRTRSQTSSVRPSWSPPGRPRSTEA